MLTTRTTTVARPTVSRRTSVRVAAAKGPFESLLRMFLPASMIDKHGWSSDAQGFSQPSGIRNRSERKPFKDGFVGKPTMGQTSDEVKQEEGEGALGYLRDAAERVVGHNFTGEETEPEWEKTGRKGWKGDIHAGKKDKGFHSRIL